MATVESIPRYGVCACGCGGLAPIASQTNARLGVKKGQPNRYIHGHNMRGKMAAASGRWGGGKSNKGPYVTVYCPDHPRAAPNGHVAEHILVAERALGKYLSLRSVVHHVNGRPADNRPENLVICEDRAYHALLHKRMRALAACGNPNALACHRCGGYDRQDNMRFFVDKKHASMRGEHPDCAHDYMARYKAQRKQSAANARAH